MGDTNWYKAYKGSCWLKPSGLRACVGGAGMTMGQLDCYLNLK